MDVRPARPEHHERIIDLFLRRSRSLTSALVTTTVVDETTSEYRALLVAHEGERLVGAGLLFRPRAAPPGLSIENIAVEEAAEHSGTGAALFAALDAGTPPEAAFTIAQVDEQEHRSVAVAERWGFVRTEVSVTSRLRLDAPPVPALPPGVVVDLSPELEFGDEDAVETMLDVSQTNPEREHGGPLTLAALRAMAPRAGAVRPTGLVLRVDGRPAAVTYAVSARGEAQVVYTGVDPALRGRGLARLAKEVLHAELAATGVTTCVTNNADDNTGIRHVNAQLGYRRTDAAVFLRRELEQTR